LNLTRNTSPVAVFPTILTLTAKEKNADSYQWQVTTADGRILNYSDQQVIIDYTKSEISGGSLLTIVLTVSKKDQSGTVCRNRARFALTESIFGKHINQGDFDNLTTS
jgi:RNase P protein component